MSNETEPNQINNFLIELKILREKFTRVCIKIFITKNSFLGQKINTLDQDSQTLGPGPFLSNICKNCRNAWKPVVTLKKFFFKLKC